MVLKAFPSLNDSITMNKRDEFVAKCLHSMNISKGVTLYTKFWIKFFNTLLLFYDKYFFIRGKISFIAEQIIMEIWIFSWFFYDSVLSLICLSPHGVNYQTHQAKQCVLICCCYVHISKFIILCTILPDSFYMFTCLLLKVLEKLCSYKYLK